MNGTSSNLSSSVQLGQVSQPDPTVLGHKRPKNVTRLDGTSNRRPTRPESHIRLWLTRAGVGAGSHHEQVCRVLRQGARAAQVPAEVQGAVERATAGRCPA